MFRFRTIRYFLVLYNCFTCFICKRQEATSAKVAAQQDRDLSQGAKAARHDKKKYEAFEQLLTPCNKTEARVGSAKFELLTCPKCDAERIRASLEYSLRVIRIIIRNTKDACSECVQVITIVIPV